LKEIGAKLKEARENIDVTIEEAANDLKMTPAQIEDIESGNIEAFNDIFYLKYFIRDYSKYLGLNYDDLVDEFNEYLFDYTSKISLAEIKEAKKDAATKDKKEDKVVSPYTLEYKAKPGRKQIIWIVISILLIIGAAIYLFIVLNSEEIPESNTVMQYTKINDGGNL
jgi:cytoskeletal protein RodZ